MALPTHIAESFHGQADACVMLGSPFTALVCRLLADRLEPDSLFARRIGGWEGNPKDDALPLRAVGGLHALARSGRCPPLSAAYPPHVAEPDAVWAGVLAAIEREDAFLSAYLDHPPQTNEVARSNAILGGCLFIAGTTGLPLELYEIGSSAGLNLAFDRYRYDLGIGEWGAADAPVRIASRWEGDAPSLTTPLTILARAGCDAKPIDPRSPADRDRLLSYIWPDQFERLARIEAALALAAQSGLRVERADAADWLEKRLAAAGTTGRARVVFHSAVWSYLSAATKERLKTMIRNAGATATAAAPIAWLSVEADGIDGSAAIRVTIWPAGTMHHLGRADYHGRWTSWQGVPILV
jgi:hypothetical protein